MCTLKRAVFPPVLGVWAKRIIALHTVLQRLLSPLIAPHHPLERVFKITEFPYCDHVRPARDSNVETGTTKHWNLPDFLHRGGSDCLQICVSDYLRDFRRLAVPE
jgi:hypothetical protein